jgi:hypothetical protein
VADVELVFRTVGERTADLALQLAREKIRPTRVHVIEDVRPFTAAVDRMLRIPHACDFVVYVDADCLILEDLVPFLRSNPFPYVDSYVSDRFHGRMHCGVHITRIDVVRAMAALDVPWDDPAFVLRPESRMRNLALHRLGVGKTFRNFDVLHDHFQYHRDIFHKYALRELKSRTPYRRRRLDDALAAADGGPADADLRVARRAVAHARTHVPEGAGPAETDAYVRGLPEIARTVLHELGLPEKGAFSPEELQAWLEARPEAIHRRHPTPRVFGIGLSRTGTRSLNAALQVLGFDTIHYPKDRETYEDLAAARYDFRILRHHDGITDITVAPFYMHLDQIFPGAKFILTVREREGWLDSCRNHWQGRGVDEDDPSPEREIHLRIRRLLRAAVYGCYEFDEQRFGHVYERHVREVLAHFEGRPQDLLVLDVCGGQGFERLAPFLGRPVPGQPFPHKGKRLSERMGEIDPSPDVRPAANRVA